MDTATDHARRLMEGFGTYLQATRTAYEYSLRTLALELGHNHKVMLDAACLSRIERGVWIPSAVEDAALRHWLLQHPLPPNLGQGR